MGCILFKPSKTLDPNKDENTRYDEQLAMAIQESWNLQESPPLRGGQQMKEEETRVTTKELESPLQDDEDVQLAEAIKQSLKEEAEIKQCVDEQVKNDEKIAKYLQNMVESPPRIEKGKNIPRRASFDVVDEELDKAIEESLKEEVERKKIEEQAKKDEQIAQDLQNYLSKMAIEESRDQLDESVLGDEDEQLTRAVEKSLTEKGKGKQSKDEAEEDEKLPEMMNPPPSKCGGCDSEIEHGKSVDISGVLWHPECLCCDACHKPIAIHQVENHVSNSRGKFHKSCYDRYCYVCKGKMRKYYQHPFWEERYCQTHESDGTPKCCSCERLEPRGTNYVMFDDRRRLCLECMESAVMDSHECQHLHFEIREYFEGLNMKIEKQFPFLLVERDALNKAEKEEKIDYQYELVTRGICLSEAQTVMSVSKARRAGPTNELIDTDKELLSVNRDSCEVTAILILYGLPRLLTGYILAHEMMHAYLRLNGHRNLNKVNEEGICQVLGHMWLESQRYSPIDPAASSSSSSASALSHTLPTGSSKKGEQSEFEKKLVEFCIYQIETDESSDYGDGFRKVNKMVTSSTLQETLKEIIRLG